MTRHHTTPTATIIVPAQATSTQSINVISCGTANFRGTMHDQRVAMAGALEVALVAHPQIGHAQAISAKVGATVRQPLAAPSQDSSEWLGPTQTFPHPHPLCGADARCALSSLRTLRASAARQDRRAQRRHEAAASLPPRCSVYGEREVELCCSLSVTKATWARGMPP
jgi:hypothetical protein